MVPVRVASMLVARFSETPVLPDDALSQAFGEWASLQHSVLEKMTRPPDAPDARAKPLMPPRQVLRQVLAMARQPGLPETDMRRLRRRVAQAEPFWPLPWVEPAVEPNEWLLVVDADPALAVFLPEVNALCDTLAEALGRSRVRLLWLEPEHADAQWHAALRLVRGQAISWVLFSDLGLRHAARRAVWAARLRNACGQSQRVQVLLPCLRAELTGLRSPPGVGLLALGGGAGPVDEAPLLDTLMAAASPFLSIDRALLRGLRVALCPGSSPLLEQQVWHHPDFDRANTDCKWKPQRQAAWLARLGERLSEPAGGPGLLPGKFAQVVWQALCQREQTESASQHLLQCWLFGEHAGQRLQDDAALPGGHAAWQAGRQYFDDLSKVLAGLERDRLIPGQGVAEPRYAAASLAHGLLRRMPERLLSTCAEQAPRLRLAADLARLAAGHSVEPVAGVDDGLLVQALQRTDADEPPQAMPMALVQRGPDLWLQRVGETEPDDGPVGGIRLATGVVRGRAAVLTVAGRQRPLMLGALPIRLGPAALVQTQQAMQLTWPGGFLGVARAQRPLGVQGWQQASEGLRVRLPPLPAAAKNVPQSELVTLQWEDAAREGRREAASSSIGTLSLPARTVKGEGLGLSFGVDAHGTFCDLALGPDRAASTQRLRWIEPGSFLMGARADEHARLNDEALRRYAQQTESPQHEVRLTSGYWLADTPCTRGLSEAVMLDRPARFSQIKDWTSRPVESVSWDRVQEFLTALQKRLPAGWEAGLPTEAQWEYAARAGTQTAYWWGDEPDSSRANWNEEQKGTTPVDRYEANPWGLYDVHGNVWEWCQGAGRKYDKRTQVDTADAAHKEHRALRGGSWIFDAGGARAAYRNSYPRGSALVGYGFRLLLRSVSKPSRPGTEGQAASKRTPAGGRAVKAGRTPAGAENSSASSTAASARRAPRKA